MRLWVLNQTSTYLIRGSSEEEREKCDPAGGRTALLIYPEGWRHTHPGPSSLPTSSRQVHLLHQLPPPLLGSHCHLPPPTAPRCLPLPSTAFYPLLPPYMPVAHATFHVNPIRLICLMELSVQCHRTFPIFSYLLTQWGSLSHRRENDLHLQVYAETPQ